MKAEKKYGRRLAYRVSETPFPLSASSQLFCRKGKYNVTMTAEALELAGHYLAQVVPVDYSADARHVAVGTVARLDFLVSWNFKHLANVRREPCFNAVNVLQGYPSVRIVASTFLIHSHEENENV